MIVQDHESICRRAEPYYYDFLCGNKQEDIPDALWEHISQCDHCRTEVYLLKIALNKGPKSREDETITSAIIANLELHFAHTGQPVSCDTVKPFLPILTDPAFDVRVPTPITVHIDKCGQCAGDLETIRSLNLSHKQLCRLGQIFAEVRNVDNELCKVAQEAIPSASAMELEMGESSTLKHLCVCPGCRELLFRHRQSICDGLEGREFTGEEFPCESVANKDLFDYCFPYGIEPAKDQYAKFRPSFTSHVSTCPACLDKMQTLHKTVSNILDRAESGIITCFSIEDASRAQATSSPGDVYSGWSIEVNVTDKRSEENWPGTEPESPSGSVARGQKKRDIQRPAYLNFKRFVKPIATAAAILLVVLLILHGPNLKATDLSQIYENLAKVKNVHITRIDPEHSRVIRETWIARGIELKVFKDDYQYMLWDIKGKARKVKSISTGALEHYELDDKDVAEVAKTLSGPLNILPFTQIAKVPKNSKWYRVTDESIETVVDDTEAYDMDWAEKSLSGPLIHWKWRCYIEIGTKLPVRTEWYKKRATEEEYSLISTAILAYPETSEILSLTRSIGF